MLKTEINKIHCIFEQSGHFKNIFKKLGYIAYDYDIENKFKETDKQIDLFKEIEKAYNNEESIFDNFKENDLILSFFPCIRFTQYENMLALCNQWQLKNLTPDQKVMYSSKIKDEQAYYYKHWCMMFAIAYKKNLKMIVENPLSKHNYLKDNFPVKNTIEIFNRREYGDYYEKPTQFWFINTNAIINFNHYLPRKEKKKLIDNRYTKEIKQEKGIDRSLISNEFIKWFINEYIIEDLEIEKLENI